MSCFGRRHPHALLGRALGHGSIRRDPRSAHDHPEPIDACRVLTDRANQAGGHDNITVIVSKFDGQGLSSSPDLDDLKYKNIPLPEDPFTQPIDSIPQKKRFVSPPKRPANAVNSESSASVQVGERLSDHGPSRFQGHAHAVGAQMSAAALAALTARAPQPPPPQAAPPAWNEPRPDRRLRSYLHPHLECPGVDGGWRRADRPWRWRRRWIYLLR